ncbi:MAG: hypothetical protein ABEJ07_06015 [Candidatus Nanohaloarchaea archaeon]
MPDQTDIEMVKYPTGRIRSFLTPGRYDWDSIELYTILDGVQRGLESIDGETRIAPEFLYLDSDGTSTRESLEGLLEAGNQSPVRGSAEFQTGPVEGEIIYRAHVPRETDAALEASFAAPEGYEGQVRQTLSDAGFSSPTIPRITRSAIEH